uniref:AIM24 family protein n=1 Tax=Streptomyces sp. NRRL S-87 TaxID=1463920 RepID=UPI0004C2152C
APYAAPAPQPTPAPVPPPPAPAAYPFTPAPVPQPTAAAPVAPPAPAPVAPAAPPAAVPAPFGPPSTATVPAPATAPPGIPGSVPPPGIPGSVPPPGVAGAAPAGVPGQPFGGGRQLAPVPPEVGLRAVLTKYAEVPVGDRWTEQNPQQVRVTLTKGQSILAKQGSMVAYQGDIDFAHKGSGLLGKLTGQLTGQGMSLMRCAGEGEVFLADEASRLFVIRLENDQLYTSAHGVLAFDEGLDTEVRRIEGAGLPGGGFFSMLFSGTGAVVVKTRGTPVVLPVGAATYVDGNAVIAWSAGAQAVTTTALRLRRSGYASAQSEAINLQFRGAPGNFVVVQPFEA